MSEMSVKEIEELLVTEVAKATTASVMLMASSPSRLAGIRAERDGASLVVTWDPAVESDVSSYRVIWGPEGEEPQGTMNVTEPRAVIRGVRQGWTVSVRAVNERGLEGWDWARVRAGG
jgi:hypothetical protein